jgi:hypothetical protein
MACHSAKRMQAGIMRGKFLLLLLRQGFINVAHTKKKQKSYRTRMSVSFHWFLRLWDLCM